MSGIWIDLVALGLVLGFFLGLVMGWFLFDMMRIKIKVRFERGNGK